MHFLIDAEIKNALNDVARVLLFVYRFRVNVPKQRAAEFHLLIITCHTGKMPRENITLSILGNQIPEETPPPHG